MKYNLLFILACLLASLQAQQPAPAVKGAAPLGAEKAEQKTGQTYAVVAGISDYQDPGIPDLRFADKDAEAFANFLRSPAGGSLDRDHLKVLLNREATMAQFASALDWLWEVCQEGDQAIIYFSGHGDVEKKSISQPGFLLCWDAPARVYMGGGAFGLAYLQEVISTLSIQNKAKVAVITDACRSGTLAGQSIGGAQATAANLAKQYANEIKILSCQPNEYSIEGEQWGGGRGAFSFNLVDALYGFADGNGDLFVTLQEVGRYLEDHVTAEVAPVSQVPMVIGNRTERMAAVDSKLLAALRSGRTSQMKMLSPVESRGMEDDVLAGVDTTTRELYRLFQQSLKDKRFLEPSGSCADAYFEKLIAEPKLARLHSAMTRNYAAALQDDAQQTLNEWLKTSQEISLDHAATNYLPRKVFTEKVRTYPRCLDRAAELLGEKHYMHAALKARKYFFEGYLLANSDMNPNRELGGKALSLFRQSLAWQPEQPQVYWQMSQVFGWNLEEPDSLEHYTRRATEMHPNWTLPFAGTAQILSQKYKQFERARLFLEQASRIDSNAAGVINVWAVYYFSQGNFTEAERQLFKATRLDSTHIWTWANLGLCLVKTNRFPEAEAALKKAIGIDSTISWVFGELGYLYMATNRLAEAEPVLKKAIALDSTNSSAWNNLGAGYFKARRYAEAEPVLKKVIALDSTNSGFWNNLGYMYIETRRYAEAEPVLKKVIALDSTNSSAWNNLGGAFLETSRNAEAEQAFYKAIALDSTNAGAWNNLGVFYGRSNRYSEAEPVLKKTIALDSTDILAWVNLGAFYAQNNRYSEAEPVLKKAISLDASIAQAHSLLGKTYFKTARAQEARQEFLKAIELSPQARTARLGMAWICMAEGKNADALDWLAQAIEKGGATYEVLQQDEVLAPLRALSEWKELMEKYFPGKG